MYLKGSPQNYYTIGKLFIGVRGKYLAFDYSLSNEKPERLKKKTTQNLSVLKKKQLYTKFTWASVMITLRILIPKLCFLKKIHFFTGNNITA